MNYPTVPEIIDQLRLYQKKAALSTANVAVAMVAFGWDATVWSTLHVGDLLSGQVQPTEAEREFIKLFMLNRFYAYNIT